MTPNSTKKFPRFFKAFFVLTFLLVNVNQSYAQFPEKLKRFNLTFESPVDLHKYLTLSESCVFGWENDDYAVVVSSLIGFVIFLNMNNDANAIEINKPIKMTSIFFLKS